MKQIIALLLVFMSLECLSQETKLVVVGNNHFNKEYYVLKSDENVKHGSFLWYAFINKEGNTYDINILETGRYSYGKKDGQWDYFYASSIKTETSLLTNNLWQSITYKNGIKDGAWTSYHLDTIQTDISTETYKKRKKSDSTIINLGIKDLTIRLSGQYQNDIRIGKWAAFNYNGELVQLYDFDQFKLIFDISLKDSSQYNGTRGALFLGGEKELTQFVRESFNPFITQYIGRDSTRLISDLVIKSNGAINQLNVLKGKATKELQQEILRIMQKTSEQWLPALDAGKPVESKKMLAIDVFILKRKWNSVQYRFKVSTLN